jgi:hypothetical protein
MLNTVGNKDKYYTPSIEEFYVGFECELRNSSSDVFDWEHFQIVGVDDAKISSTLMDWSFYDSRNAIEEEQVRVKYLDKEDIESLGFVTDPSGERYYELGEYQLYVDIHPIHNITIYNWDSTVIFQGTIKNKSELKQVLKMIGVEYENTNS